MTRDGEIIDSFLDFLKELYGDDVCIREERHLKDSHKIELIFSSHKMTRTSWCLWRVQSIWFASDLYSFDGLSALINGVWGSLDYRFADERKSDD